MIANYIKSRAWLVAAALAGSTAGANAMPAYPKSIALTQPDGTRITICLKGDERMHWAETTDGYTLLHDNEGYWTFAKADGKGNIACSDMRFNGSTAEAKAIGLKPRLRFSEKQMQRAKAAANAEQEFLIDGTFPAKGKHKLLMLLVNFSDTKTKYTQQDFHNMMNQKGYGGIGSFRDYYLEQSYGLLDIDVSVTDWITLPKTKAAYGAEGAKQIIFDALTIASQTLDMKQFDNDGDGIIDGLCVVHQGAGQEVSGNAADIWSHSDIIYGQKFGGVELRRYTIEPEVLTSGGQITNIGVICHEFGHALGAPDFYDTDYSQSGGEYCGTGVWDLLGSGAWAGSYGNRPTGINAWQKCVWGWLSPAVLDKSQTVSNMPAADKSPTCYRMETGTPGEYFIMENRQNTGTFDASLPGHGLVVYHVNENIIGSKLKSNNINATHPQGIYTVCADAGADPDNSTASYGSVNSGAAPFPGDYGHTELSDKTYPSTHSTDGRYAYRALTNISESNGCIGFDFKQLDEPAKPSELKAVAKNGSITLTWNKPEGNSIDHYNIYRNDTKIGSSTTTTYTDDEPTGGVKLVYKVDVAYADGLLSHTVATQTMVPANFVNDITVGDNDTNGTQLAWTTNNSLTRADIFGGNMATTEVAQSEVEYANMYTPDDLRTFVGGTITKMAFLPAQGPSDMTVKLHVWEGNADGTDMKLVSERSAKEFASGQRRELKLTQPVKIKKDKTYWLAVNCTSKSGAVSVAMQQDLLTDGRGNCLLNNGKFEPYTPANGNFYVAATVVPTTKGEDYEDGDNNNYYDADKDLCFPLAYSVYVDSKLMCRTTARECFITDLPAGNHNIGIASYYRGGNESAPLTKSIEVLPAGINGATKACNVSVSGAHHSIRVQGFEGNVSISDASGCSHIAKVHAEGTSINAASGFYLVTPLTASAHTTYKVIVE